MENENGLSEPNSFSYNGRYAPLSPFPFSGAVESKGNFKSLESANNCHQRRSSESFLAEEDQPSWLDDLLNDSETFTHRGHRRSASDSYAFLGGEAADTLTSKFVNLSVEDSFETKANSNADDNNNNNQDLEELVYNIAVDHRRDESSSQSTETSGDRASGAQANISGSKAESKRAKQHNAHRSRVRKLQYIAHLERTVQILKAEGTEVSAELEFLEQQNLILTMENRALRQRMESISQEQIIKHWEQGMLEREIGRLQTLYHLQNQQQMQMHQQKQQQPNKGHPKHRRNRSRDHLDHQINNSTLKNKDVRDSVNGPTNGPIRA